MYIRPDKMRPQTLLSSGEVHVRQLEAILKYAARECEITRKRAEALEKRKALDKWMSGSREELEIAERLANIINEARGDVLSVSDSSESVELRRKYLDGDSGAVEQVVYSALAHLRDPDAFPFDIHVQWSSESRVSVIEYLLPNFDEISIVKDKVGAKTTSTVSVSKAERRNFVNDVPYALAIRALHAVVNADEAKQVAGVAFNGILRFTDPATGHVRTRCVMSVMATRAQIKALQIDKVVPRECFLALKGLAGPQLADRVPVPPIVQFNRADSRIIESRDMLSEVEAQTNLATMDWMDFEHFIRQIFEKEFGRDGVEVKVTQSSRDRGVDAIAFDPDPIRGGKIVIQAKRYTRLVDVSAVRDLYGTVMNEGANKGILVTTSSFGKDSWEFAKDKPLTLLDGGNLLHLLQKHGQRFRIDLAEARRLQALQPK